MHYRPVSSGPLIGTFDIDDVVRNIITGAPVPNFHRGKAAFDWHAVRARGAI